MAKYETTKYSSVYTRKIDDGTLNLYIHYRLSSGKRVFEKTPFVVAPGKNGVSPSKIDEAANRAARLRAQKIEGITPTNALRRKEERAKKERWTIDRLWLEYIEQRFNGKPEQSDLSHYSVHLEKPFGKKEPKELGPLDLKRVSNAMIETHAPATCAKALALLRRIVNFGIDNQLVPPLFFKIKLPKVDNERTESMDNEQMADYLKAAQEWPNPIERAYVLFMLFTGARRTEARKLQWPDVNMARGFVTLRNTKSGKAERIPLNDQAVDLLRNIPRNEQNPHVFHGEHGAARGSKQLDTAARKIRNAAGLPESFRPCHGLRHSFASSMASSGEVDLYTLQKLMTHKSPMMTQRYAHLHDEALKRGANVMAKILASVEGGNV